MGSEENRVGEVLASKYRLEALLGSGGMGHVYRAVNEHVGRVCAIKVLRKEHAENAEVVDRFLREARAANLVRHPNVVDVLDIGKEDGGAPFIVQELLDGEDLAHLAARRGGKLEMEEVVELLGPVIDAVAEAHARGVIHRDIKPENVFLAKGPRGTVPKLLDFGISKIRAHDLRATEVGVMMGTPAYMPPEQIQGARDADPRSDVWALGIMLFELLAGRLPFDAQDAPALFFAIATKDAPTLLEARVDVTPALSRVVERCLRRRPDDRYPTAAELARDLRHAVDGSDLEATGQHSLPPPGARPGPLVPDLQLPSTPFAPTITRDAARAVAAKTELGGAMIELEGEGKPLPETPELGPHAALRAPGSRGAPSTKTREAANGAPLQLAPPSSGVGSTSRRAVGAELSGVGLAPGPAAASPRTGSHETWGIQGSTKERADLSPIIGLGVVGLVAILGTGLLMQLAHRPEGWPLARFAFAPGQMVEIVMHGALALVAIGVGIAYCHRGVRHWRGELAGGGPNAVFNAVVAAGAFFCAIELVSAVS